MTADAARLEQSGQVLPLFALLLVLLLLPVTALAVDGGLLISAHSQLVGTAQAAAEAGSQAVDVSALEHSGSIVICVFPDPGTTCGNGIGDVSQVVGRVVLAAYPALPDRCSLVAPSALAPAPGTAAGCELAVATRCQSSSSQVDFQQGVSVLLWRTASIPLLTLGPWSKVAMVAGATAWLTHGYVSPEQSPLPKGATC